VIATNAVKDINQLHSHFSDFDGSQHFFQLDLNRVDNQIFIEDTLKEQLGIILKHRVDMSFLLIELDSKKYT
jgi:hypothetical protein